MWISAKRLEHLEKIEQLRRDDVASVVETWHRTASAQLKALADGQDKLLQSHAALEQQASSDKAVIDSLYRGSAETLERLNRLNKFVGANQAVLDTLAQRQCDAELAVRASLAALEKRFDDGIETSIHVKDVVPRRHLPSANGKRKRRAA